MKSKTQKEVQNNKWKTLHTVCTSFSLAAARSLCQSEIPRVHHFSFSHTYLSVSLPRSLSHIHKSLSLAAACSLSQCEILRVHHLSLSHTQISFSRCHALSQTYTHFCLLLPRTLLCIHMRSLFQSERLRVSFSLARALSHKLSLTDL